MADLNSLMDGNNNKDDLAKRESNPIPKLIA